MTRVYHNKNPDLWNTLLTSGQGHLVTAIKQLRRIGCTNTEIRGMLEVELRRGE